MKKLVWIILLLIACANIYAQRKPSAYDTSVAKMYNLLYNKPFTNVALEDTSGNVFDASAIAGKTVYVDFWFTNCPPCIKEIPFSTSLQQFFAADTNVVFVSICIDNNERKTAWRQMIKDREMKGIHLFCARNKPQKVSLVTEYLVNFPTYLLVNSRMKVIGYNAPRPSEEGWVHWAIVEAEKNNRLSSAYFQLIQQSKNYREFINSSWPAIVSLRPAK